MKINVNDTNNINNIDYIRQGKSEEGFSTNQENEKNNNKN